MSTEIEEVITLLYSENQSEFLYTYLVKRLATLADDRLYDILDTYRYACCGGGEEANELYLTADFDNVKHDPKFIEYLVNVIDYPYTDYVYGILSESEENKKFMKIQFVNRRHEGFDGVDDYYYDNMTILINNNPPIQDIENCGEYKFFTGFDHFPELNGIKYCVTSDNYQDIYTLLCMIIAGVRDNVIKYEFPEVYGNDGIYGVNLFPDK